MRDLVRKVSSRSDLSKQKTTMFCWHHAWGMFLTILSGLQAFSGNTETTSRHPCTAYVCRIDPLRITPLGLFSGPPDQSTWMNDSHRIWSRNGQEGCSGMLHDVITVYWHSEWRIYNESTTSSSFSSGDFPWILKIVHSTLCHSVRQCITPKLVVVTSGRPPKPAYTQVESQFLSLLESCRKAVTAPGLITLCRHYKKHYFYFWALFSSLVLSKNGIISSTNWENQHYFETLWAPTLKIRTFLIIERPEFNRLNLSLTG